MEAKQLQALLEEVIDIAKRASQKILAVYNTDFAVEQKGDLSPLTEADLAANDEISSSLRKLSPLMPILSEESTQVPFAERKTWHRYWLVDPLDGTREFVKRNGEFTVNIALIEDQQPILGVVWVPVSGVCYAACRGFGALKIEPNGQRKTIKTRSISPDHMVVVGSRSHSNEATRSYVGKLGKVELIGIGSSLKVCLVAEGRADIYPRFGPTSEWDTAAAHCVVEQSGGRLTNTELEPLLYNAKESVLNPFFIVVGDTSHDWAQYSAGD